MIPHCGLLAFGSYLFKPGFVSSGLFVFFISEHLKIHFWCWPINHYCWYLKCCWSQPSALIRALAWLNMQGNWNYSAQWNLFLLFRFSLCHFWTVATDSECVLIGETISAQFTVDLYPKQRESSEIYSSCVWTAVLYWKEMSCCSEVWREEK